MKWPQFELWRVLVTVTLFGASLGCFLKQSTNYDTEFLLLAASVVLLGAAIGTPFRKGVLGAFCAPGLVWFFGWMYVFLSGFTK